MATAPLFTIFYKIYLKSPKSLTSLAISLINEMILFFAFLTFPEVARSTPVMTKEIL
jgi:hypothetical protein